MKDKITRQMIENNLNDRIVDIFAEPTMKRIENFGEVVNFFIREGYPISNYLGIYEELKVEYCINDYKDGEFGEF